MAIRIDLRLSHTCAMILCLGLLAPGTALGQEEATASSTEPAAVLAVPGADMVPVPFSVAPIEYSDRKITALVDRHHCGARWNEKPKADAVYVESAEAITVRVDVRAGTDGRPCPNDRLERIKLKLDADLGGRAIIDAERGAPAYVNVVDPIDTGLEYDCNFGAGDGIPIATWLGPGLDVSGLGVESTIEDARAIVNRGDLVTFIGPLSERRKTRVETWWLQGGVWDRAGWGSCLPMAARTPGIDAATWRPRGRLPGADARSVDVWVNEWACASGRPPVGRITRPIIQVRKDSIVIIMGTQSVSAFPRQRSASRAGGRFAMVDCQGVPPAPYTVKLPVKLGQRTLYDGGVYPPREYSRRSR